MATVNVSACGDTVRTDSIRCVEEVLSDSALSPAEDSELQSNGRYRLASGEELEEKIDECDEDDVIFLDSDDEEGKESAEVKKSVDQISPDDSIGSECLAPEGLCDVVASPAHAGCQPLFMSHVFKDLPPIDSLANVRIRTPLEFMLYAHIAQSLATDVAREVIEKIRASDQPLLKAYHTYCKGLIPSLIFSETVFRAAFEMRLKTCRVAFSSLKASAQKRIFVTFDIPLTTDDVSAEIISEWRKVFEQCRFALDELRAKMIYPDRKYLRNSTVLIGDNEAKELSTLANAHLITEKTPKELLKTLKRYYFSSTTKALLLCWGADDLRAGLSEEEIGANIVSVVDVLKESSVRVIVVPPAFNQLKAKTYNKLLHVLDNHFRENANPNVVLALVSRTFRSLSEVTRFGNYFNCDRVSIDGYLTREGKHQTLVHLKAVYHIGSFYNVKYAENQNSSSTIGAVVKKKWSPVKVGNNKKAAKSGLSSKNKMANAVIAKFNRNANRNNVGVASVNKQTGKKKNLQPANNKRRLPSPVREMEVGTQRLFGVQPHAVDDQHKRTRKAIHRNKEKNNTGTNLSPWLAATDYSNIAHSDYHEFLQQSYSSTCAASFNEPSPWIAPPPLYGGAQPEPYYAEADYTSLSYQSHISAPKSFFGAAPKNRAFGGLTGSNAVEQEPHSSNAFSNQPPPRGFFGMSGGRSLDEVYALQCLNQYNQTRNY